MLHRFCSDKFGWLPTKANELLEPVVKAFDERETQLRMDQFFAYSQRFAKIKSQRLQKAVRGTAKVPNPHIELKDDELSAASPSRSAPKRRGGGQQSGPARRGGKQAVGGAANTAARRTRGGSSTSRGGRRGGLNSTATEPSNVESPTSGSPSRSLSRPRRSCRGANNDDYAEGEAAVTGGAEFAGGEREETSAVASEGAERGEESVEVPDIVQTRSAVSERLEGEVTTVAAKEAIALSDSHHQREKDDLVDDGAVLRPTAMVDFSPSFQVPPPAAPPAVVASPVEKPKRGGMTLPPAPKRRRR
mmetsp:Transcript_32394/g.57984  ORF Transcript_32394/g.57984 Transcript_32394/m.57984 type:complete len:304 (-) Transcript_32394:343-1254(-)